MTDLKKLAVRTAENLIDRSAAPLTRLAIYPQGSVHRLIKQQPIASNSMQKKGEQP